MKKLSLLLVVLLAAGSAGLYGQMAIGTNFIIEGDATATAGYDIDDQQFGFKNAFDSNIRIELVPKQKTNNDDMVGMSGWVGSIELKDFYIYIDSDVGDKKDDGKDYVHDGEEYVHTTATASADEEKSRIGLYIKRPVIVAKLKNGPLWFQIFDAPAGKADLIAHVEADEHDDRKAESHDDGKDVGLDLGGHGVTFGYTTDDLSLSVGVLSEEAYDSESENGVVDDPTTNKDETKAPHKGSYAVGGDLKVNVGPATLDVAFVQGLENADEPEDSDHDDDTGVGVKLTTDFGDISLAAGADVALTGEQNDVDTPENESMDWEAGGNLTVTLTPNTTLKTDVLVSTAVKAATDVAVKLSDDSGLVENLAMSVKWGMFDMSYGDSADDAPTDQNDEMDMFVEGKLDYGLDAMGGTLTPGTTVTVNQLDGANAVVGLEARAVLTEAVPATTFGLKWKSGQLLKTDDSAAQQGTVTLWTKIKY